MIGKLIGYGRTAEVFEYGDNKVVKLFSEKINFAEIETELSKHQMIERTIGCCVKSFGIVKVANRYGIVFQRVEGLPLTEVLMSGTRSPIEIGQILGQLHSKIHLSTCDTLPGLKSMVKCQIANSCELNENEKKILLSVLESLPDSNTTCHLDFHPDNVFLNGEQLTLIDWMTAQKGDYLADVARTLMILEIAELPNGNLQENITLELAREQIIKGYQNAYSMQIDIEERRLEKWKMIMLGLRLSERISDTEKLSIKSKLVNLLTKYEVK